MNYTSHSLPENQAYLVKKAAQEGAQDRYGLRIAARLSDATGQLPHDVSERLRAARTQAMAKRKIASTRTASSVVASGGAASLTFGDENFSLWDRIASALPLIALLAGLVVITVVQNDNRAREVAEIDAALLTDDLPPAAYVDPGFAQFLKSRREQSQ
jgi:Protein of unknown function (DUF3619)